MKVSNMLDLNLTLTFTNKYNKTKDIFNIGDYVYITYEDCNEGFIHVEGVILAFNSSEIIIQKQCYKVESIFYSSITDIIRI